MENNCGPRKSYPIFIILFLSLVCFCNTSTYSQIRYSYNYHITSNEDTLHYRYIEPAHVHSKKKYPLILFLHGAGERGNDNETQLKHGSGVFLHPANIEKYPAFVLFPQCPKEEFGPFALEPPSLDGATFPMGQEMSPFITQVKSLLDDYLKRPEVDKNRIYIIGLSMGGMGTYDLVCRFPDIFAAAISICGSVNVQRLPKAAHVCFRIFHGEKDEVIPVKCAREAYDRLKKNRAKVEYIEFYGCNHLSWNNAFNRPDFMDWLFKQKKIKKYLFYK